MIQFHNLTDGAGRVKTIATFAIGDLHADVAPAEEGAEPGTFSAIASTFNTRVKGLFYDQVLKPGAFGRSLAEHGLPALVWSHDWDTPPIGVTLEASETAEGLFTRGRLFVADGEESPVARQVWTAMRAKNGDGRPALREFSIGFSIVEADWEVHDEEEILAIHDVDLIEFGPTLKGRNLSRLIDVHGASDPSDDPILARFPRRHKTESAALRALKLAKPRRI